MALPFDPAPVSAPDSALSSFFIEGPPKVFDPVDRPVHYAFGGIEAIEALESCMSQEAFRGFLKGNVIKYVWRYEQKNGLEDLRKAKWYLKALIFALENEEEEEALAAIENNCKDGFCPMPGARIGTKAIDEPIFSPINNV